MKLSKIIGKMVTIGHKVFQLKGFRSSFFHIIFNLNENHKEYDGLEFNKMENCSSFTDLKFSKRSSVDFTFIYQKSIPIKDAFFVPKIISKFC